MAYGVKDNGFSTFLLIFYNQVIGLDAGLVSAALMMALIIDGFADPIIGYLSDRTYTRWGRRLPWLILAPFPLAGAWLFLWSPPAGLGHWIFAYLVIAAIIVRTLITCCEVPSVSLIPELTRDYDERTGIMRYRYLFGWAGGLITLYLAYGVFLVPDATHKIGQLNPAGYWHYGLFGAALMSLSVLISAVGQRKRISGWPKARPAPITISQAFAEIRSSFSHPAFVTLILAGMITYTSQGITFALANYLYLYVWHLSTGALAWYPITLFVSVICTFLIVSPLSKRFDKRPIAMVSGLLGTFFWVAPFLLLQGGLWPSLDAPLATPLLNAFFFAANLFTVMVAMVGSSMMADIVEASEVETGRRSEALFYSGGMFMQKCATGIGIFIAGLIVSLSGLVPGSAPEHVSPDVTSPLIISYCLIIAILAVIATWAFAHFPISRKDHLERLQRLES